jgi:hypothetical protein
MTLPFQLSAPLPFTALLDRAMRETRRHGRTILPSIALPVAALTAAVPAVQAAYLKAIGEPSGDPFQILVPGCTFSLVIFGLLAFMGIAFTAMQGACVDSVAGRPVDMRRAWRFAVRPRVLGTLFLVGLVLAGLTILCLIPVVLGAAVGAAVNPFLGFALGIAAALLILLVLVLTISFLGFVTPAMADEGVFFGAAMGRSLALARYNPHRRLLGARPAIKLMALLLVGGVISSIVSFLVSAPFAIPQWFEIFRKISSGEAPDPTAWLWLQVIGQFVGALASTAVYLYVSFGVALLFFDTRGRKEGTDLALAIDAMAVPPPVPPPGAPLAS